MGILKAEEWKPSIKMTHGELPQSRCGQRLKASGVQAHNTVFLALFDLIENPNPDDPLVSSIVSSLKSQIIPKWHAKLTSRPSSTARTVLRSTRRQPR